MNFKLAHQRLGAQTSDFRHALNKQKNEFASQKLNSKQIVSLDSGVGKQVGSRCSHKLNGRAKLSLTYAII